MLELLYNRRSTRKFKTTPISQEILEQLIKVALLAPSSRSIRPWEFVIVDDKNLLYQLSNCREHGAHFLKDAPLGIVIIADSTKSDVWVEDCSIAATLIQLQAEKLNIGSCWIQVRNRTYAGNVSSSDFIKETLKIPSYFDVEAMIALGEKDESKPGYSEVDLHLEKVKHNQFSSNYFKE